MNNKMRSKECSSIEENVDGSFIGDELLSNYDSMISLLILVQADKRPKTLTRYDSTLSTSSWH